MGGGVAGEGRGFARALPRPSETFSRLKQDTEEAAAAAERSTATRQHLHSNRPRFSFPLQTTAAARSALLSPPWATAKPALTLMSRDSTLTVPGPGLEPHRDTPTTTDA